jgi:hypothetical protein
MSQFASILIAITFQCSALASGLSAKPYFSWDTVPVYIHFGKSSGPLSDIELKFVAQVSDFVCLEKGHGRGSSGSTEEGIANGSFVIRRASQYTRQERWNNITFSIASFGDGGLR